MNSSIVQELFYTCSDANYKLLTSFPSTFDLVEFQSLPGSTGSSLALSIYLQALQKSSILSYQCEGNSLEQAMR